jgi:hypothetical protein
MGLGNGLGFEIMPIKSGTKKSLGILGKVFIIFYNPGVLFKSPAAAGQKQYSDQHCGNHRPYLRMLFAKRSVHFISPFGSFKINDSKGEYAIYYDAVYNLNKS